MAPGIQILLVSTTVSLSTIACFLVGFLVLKLFFGKEALRRFVVESNFLELALLSAVATWGILPLRWFLAYMGGWISGWIWVAMMIAGGLTLKGTIAGEGKQYFRKSAWFFLFLMEIALLFSGAWWEVGDVLLGQNRDVISVRDQGDLWSHYALSQHLAYGSLRGFHPSPLGFPAKLTIGSFMPTLWGSTLVFVQTLGFSKAWSVISTKLGYMFSFQLIVLGFCSLVWQVLSRARKTGDDLSQATKLLITASVGALTYAIGMSFQRDPGIVDNLFIHSINNGGGCAVIIAFIASTQVLLKYFPQVSRARIAGFLLFLTPMMLFSRANWALFICGLIGCSALGILLWDEGRKAFVLSHWKRIQEAPVAVALGVVLTLFASVVFLKTAFPWAYPFPGVKIRLNASIQEALESWVEYHLWYPEHRKWMLGHLNLAMGTPPEQTWIWFKQLVKAVLWDLGMISVILGLWWKTLRQPAIRIALGVALLGHIASRFLIHPIYDNGSFGSSEPLGHAFIMLCVLFITGFGLTVAGLLKDRKPATQLILSSLFFVGTAMVAQFGLSSAVPSPSVVYPRALVRDLRKECAKAPMAITTGRTPLSVLTGCYSADNYRYSLKLSHNGDRFGLQNIYNNYCAQPGSADITLLNTDFGPLKAVCNRPPKTAAAPAGK